MVSANFAKKHVHFVDMHIAIFLAIRCMSRLHCSWAECPRGSAPAGVINLDVILVVDRTTSISAEDYDGQKPRLEGVKSDLLSLIERLKGARIALITFDSSARISVPFTSDGSAAATALRALDQEVSTY